MPEAIVQAAQKALRSGDLALLAYKTPDFSRDMRYLLLDHKESYMRGDPYAMHKRPFDWNGAWIPKEDPYRILNNYVAQRFPSNPAPIKARRPSAPYYLGRVIVDRFVGMLFGKERFPYLQVPGDTQTEAYLNALVKSLDMRAWMTEAARIGGAMGSVIVMFHVDEGRFKLECFNPKHCQILWKDRHCAEMSAFNIVYPFPKEEYDEELKKWVEHWYLYRRVVTESMTITFYPQRLRKSGTHGRIVLENENERAQIDPDLTFQHNFGFVPAQFIQNLPSYANEDGDSLCEGAYDLFDTISELLSALAKGLQGNLDPTLLIKLAIEDYKKLQNMGGFVQTGTTGQAIVVGDKGDGKYLEIEGNAIQLSLQVVERLEEYACKVCACVLPNPERITGIGQSGSAMAKMYEAMLSKLDELRVQYGDRGIKPLLMKMVAAGYKFGWNNLKPLKRYDPEQEKMIQLQPKQELDCCDIELRWGRYFTPTADDVFKASEAAFLAAGKRPVTTLQRAVEFMADFINDPDPYVTLTKLHEEIEELHEHEEELLRARHKPENSKEESNNSLPQGESEVE